MRRKTPEPGFRGAYVQRTALGDVVDAAAVAHPCRTQVIVNRLSDGRRVAGCRQCGGLWIVPEQHTTIGTTEENRA